MTSYLGQVGANAELLILCDNFVLRFRLILYCTAVF